ncbi:hypothetical protein CCAX7_56180 [Capsulimonas corticalis]|uniref:Uncharacterized protein n=1 Tax=Capsulimonas corticalis TaxID=2219043 RepID=A0A402D0S0_9BACT|nr:hypothetical protein [Capsulimonas corticalis]BDI33567.1 hypothetical protein CCAX7_56180 [Capsulimonas corticalis]
MARFDLSGSPIFDPDDNDASAPAPQTPPPYTPPGRAAGTPPQAPPPGFANDQAPPWAGQSTSGARPPAAGAPASPGTNAGPRAPRAYPIDPPRSPLPTPDYDSPYSGNDSGHNATVPPEVAALRWNWGAFFLPPMWCASHGVPTLGYIYDLIAILFLLSPFVFGPTYALLVFFSTAFLMFGIGIYLGARGNEIAWRNRAFDNGVDGFFLVQKGWLISSFAIALPIYVILLGAFGYQVVRASRQQQELVNRALASQNAPQPQQVPASEAPRPVFQPSGQPTQTIIYGRPPGEYNRETFNRGGFPGGMNTRSPIVIIQRVPGAPAASPATPPGAAPADPNAAAAQSQSPASPYSGQPTSLPAQPAPAAPDQNAAPSAPAAQEPPQNGAPPEMTAPPQNAAPQDAAPPAQSAYPGLPPGQQ